MKNRTLSNIRLGYTHVALYTVHWRLSLELAIIIRLAGAKNYAGKEIVAAFLNIFFLLWDVMWLLLLTGRILDIFFNLHIFVYSTEQSILYAKLMEKIAAL